MDGEASGGAYAPRRILVTGGAGFIGSHVVILLARKYPAYSVVNLDKLDYCASLRNLEQAGCAELAVGSRPFNYKFKGADMAFPDLVNHVFVSERIDTVLHFAAQTHVDNSFGNSFSFTQNNVLGIPRAARGLQASRIKRFVHGVPKKFTARGVPDDSKVMLEGRSAG